MVNHLKTRTGGTVKLADLLDEAIERATVLIKLVAYVGLTCIREH